MDLGASELEPALIFTILREKTRRLILRAGDQRNLVLIPVQIGYLTEMPLDCKFGDPSSFGISLPLVHGTVESVSEYFLIVIHEQCTIIGMLVALHGTQGGFN